MLTDYWPLAATAVATWLAGWLLMNTLSGLQALSKFPVANKVSGLRSSAKSKEKFRTEGNSILVAALKKVLTDTGPNIILPPSYIDQLKNDPRLNFDEVHRKEFFASYPGFEGFQEATGPNRFVQETVRVKLTQNLAKMTTGLSREMADILDEKWTRSTEWHDMGLRQTVLDIVSRLSVLVFLGPELCNDAEWLDIAVNHAVTAITAAKKLRAWPPMSRPLVHWFLPECRKLRAEVERARTLLSPIIETRRNAKGTKEYNDMITWMDDVANGRPYHALSAQLGLSFAAIHTTSDLLSQLIMDLTQNPELIPALREEASTVLREDGWEKTSLYKMRLLDSCMKESQRLKPPGAISMRRLPMEQITLRDGTVLPKGVPVCITNAGMRDPETYPDPERFDGRRFLNMRETAGNESVGQFVSTSPIHYGFGHGKHACPGRFFAANETKIAMAHILLKYDFELAPGNKPRVFTHGFEQMADPTQVLRVRRRADAPEI